jgi:hypothetical protein
MNALARLETWCANVVERAFARAFPSVLEPAQIARKLVATIERSPPPADADRASRYVVAVSAADHARLAAERTLLEGQWSKMARALCARAGIVTPAPPEVTLAADAGLSDGTILIAALHPATTRAQPRSLRVEGGAAPGKTYALPIPQDGFAALLIGRDPACDVVVTDPRVSRRHARVFVREAGLDFEDLGSSNGTLCNGDLLVRGELRVGDRLQVGDTTLIVDADAPTA